jgi:hypothetical protein
MEQQQARTGQRAANNTLTCPELCDKLPIARIQISHRPCDASASISLITGIPSSMRSFPNLKLQVKPYAKLLEPGLAQTRAIEAPVTRIDGTAKVTGAAPYAFEHRLERPAYAHRVQATGCLPSRSCSI